MNKLTFPVNLREYDVIKENVPQGKYPVAELGELSFADELSLKIEAVQKAKLYAAALRTKGYKLALDELDRLYSKGVNGIL